MARSRNPNTMPASAVVVRQVNAKDQYAAIQQAIEAKRDAIVSTLVKTIDPERFIAVALQAVTRSPKLLSCTPASIVKALRDAAELGLEPSGLLGSAYLVPYRHNWKDEADNWHNDMDAQLIPGYRGLIDLARRSGEVRTVEAHVVRERDVFEYEFGSMQRLVHRPYLNLHGDTIRVQTPDGEWIEVAMTAGDPIAFYAFARLASGEFQFEVMTKAEVDAIRARSKAADDGPWVTDYVEMGRKTPTRKLLKYLPLSALALTRALELEDLAEQQATEGPPSTPALARSALQAQLLAPRQDASGAPEANGEGNDTSNDASASPDASLTASDDADGSSPVTETRVDAPTAAVAASVPEICGAPAPWPNATCVRLTPHIEGPQAVPHADAEGSTWPVK